MPSRPLTARYTFAEPDLSVICQRRGIHNRLGFAVQLCYLRYPGFALPTDAEPPTSLLNIVGRQLRIEPEIWPQNAQRPQTRREHLLELQAWPKLTSFAVADYWHFVHQLADLVQQTDRGIVLAVALVELLRLQRIILPTGDVIERVCSEALTRGTRQTYEALTGPLGDFHPHALDGLLAIREGPRGSGLTGYASRPACRSPSMRWPTWNG